MRRTINLLFVFIPCVYLMYSFGNLFNDYFTFYCFVVFNFLSPV